MRSLYFAIGLCAFLAGCADKTSPPTSIAEDNTAINQRDAEGHTATPADQSNNQTDIDLTARIRASVLAIDDLSVNGRNVKIISADGNVVLRGPVATAAEKDKIGKVALDIADDGHVTNDLEVIPVKD